MSSRVAELTAHAGITAISCTGKKRNGDCEVKKGRVYFEFGKGEEEQKDSPC